MKTIVIFLVLLWQTLICPYAETPNLAAKSTTQWKEIDNSDDIKIFERWISIGDSLQVRERMGQVILTVQPEMILSKIIEIENWSLWMNNVNSAHVIKKTAHEMLYVYTLFEIPWPFNNRDMVAFVQVKTNSSTKETIVEISSTEGLLSQISDIDRITGYSACWTISPINNNQVRLTFSCYSTQPPAFPRWIMDPILRKIFFNNLLNFKQQVESEMVLISKK